MIKRELHIFLTAIMFYTRIPCPRWVDHRPEYINLSTRYFPLIGWIAGSVYAGIILLLLTLFSPLLCVLAGLTVSVLLTGAFHEDGFADVCDGFGGGWTKEKILMIMKDSRVGTYAVVGLLLIFAFKITLTQELVMRETTLSFFLIIVSSHVVSRMMSVMVIFFSQYARDENEESKAKPVAAGISKTTVFVALFFTIVPFVLLISFTHPVIAFALIPSVLVTLYLMYYFKKWIGGYTGDCLGAVQQLNEVIFLASVLALWKLI